MEEFKKIENNLVPFEFEHKNEKLEQLKK